MAGRFTDTTLNLTLPQGEIDLDGKVFTVAITASSDGSLSGTFGVSIYQLNFSHNAKGENTVTFGLGRDFDRGPLGGSVFTGVGFDKDGVFIRISFSASVDGGPAGKLSAEISRDVRPEDVAALFDRAGHLIDEAHDRFDDLHLGSFFRAEKLASPLVMDYDGDGQIEYLPRETGGVFFDIDGDGQREWTAWVAPEDALLALDVNGNGQIDGVGELFGTETDSGFAKLAVHDGNGDRSINAGDAVYSQLIVWRDLDGDGLLDQGEGQSLAQAGIRSIDLRAVDTDLPASGGVVREVSSFTRTDGSSSQIVDIWFETTDLPDVSAFGRIAAPAGDIELAGFGALETLSTAADKDVTLDTQIKGFGLGRLLTGHSLEDARAILFRWAGVGSVDPASRGVYVDARELGFLEKFVDQPFSQSGSAIPRHDAGGLLTSTYVGVQKYETGLMLLQGPLMPFLPKALYVAAGDAVVSTIEDMPSTVTVAGFTTAIASYDAGEQIILLTALRYALEGAAPAFSDAFRHDGLAGISAAIGDALVARGAARGLAFDALEVHTDAPATGYLASGAAPLYYIFGDGADTVTLGGATGAFGGGGDDSIVARFSSTPVALAGGDGNDILVGTSGADTLDGGAGDDAMYGQEGDDTYIVDSTGDVVVETSGNDLVRSSVSLTLFDGVERLVLTGDAALDGTGNALNNTILGNGADNRLSGGAGNDVLDGGAGADTMIGGTGDDSYTVDDAGDVIIEQPNEGTETVYTLISYSFARQAALNNLVALGTDAIALTGNDSANVITGNSGANLIDGGLGADRMTGGAGNDSYMVDNTSDSVVEVDGGGDDFVTAGISYTLGANVERLTLMGEENLSATGNTLANVLVGNSGDNLLNGLAGADIMTGGAGNDSYVVDDAGDKIVETSAGGYDKVTTSLASYTLAATLEALVYSGTQSFAGVGNKSDNVITGSTASDTLTGNAGNDRLDGRGGADVMTGGAGNDYYYVDNAGDTVIELARGGTDTIEATVSVTAAAEVENVRLAGSSAISATGNALDNRIDGNGAANRLDGGAGADVLVGGAGDDIYVVDNAGDMLFEAAGAGTDSVAASVSWRLGDNFENLTLTGDAAIGGTGNALNNLLIGNAGKNELRGGAGDDTYEIDAGDTVVEASGEGYDTVRIDASYRAVRNVERVTALGTGDWQLTGNALGNRLDGNAGANVLNGGSGADQMYGGAGDDVYIVDDTGDAVIESAAGGDDQVRSSVSFTLGSNVERLLLTGSHDLNGTGNTLANALTGNDGANVLNGGAGADTLRGGLGDDTYVVDNADDVVVETDDAGRDLVQTSLATYALVRGVELLSFTGTADATGTGNELANVITGNRGADRLVGGGGDDRLIGAAGADALAGGAGNDILDGGSDVDTMAGGTGDDVYIVDSTADVVTEYSGEGVDRVETSVSFIMTRVVGGTETREIETLLMTGTASIDAQGNALANEITGNSGSNVLDGSLGADRLFGGGGNDTFVVDNAGDRTFEAQGGGIDTVRATLDWTLAPNVEGLILLGDLALSGTGNELANTIEGNIADNRIAGLIGADTLRGGAGADVFLYFATAESDTGLGVDFIADFSAGEGDRIDLSAIDGNVATPEIDGFVFVSQAAFTAPGQIRVVASGTDYRLLINTDGDASTEMQIVVHSDTAPSDLWFG